MLGWGTARQACPPLPLPLLWTRTPLPVCQESGGRGVHQPPNWFWGRSTLEGRKEGKGEAEAKAEGTSLPTGHSLKGGRAHWGKGLSFWEHFPGGLASAAKVSDPWTFHLGTSCLTTLAVLTLREGKWPEIGGKCVYAHPLGKGSEPGQLDPGP